MVNFAINNLSNPEILTLTVDGSILTHSNEVKFLGIILDNNLKFYNHIDHVSKKNIFRNINFYKKPFDSFSTKQISTHNLRNTYSLPVPKHFFFQEGL